MNLKKILATLLIWRIRNVNMRNFLIILAGITGTIGGLAAVLLKSVVFYVQALLTDFDHSYAYVLFPLIGIVITMFIVKYVLKEVPGYGVTTILYIISKKSSIVRRSLMYSRMLISAITVGFGGSVGLEAPIMVTGSAIGSNIGRLMHLNYKQRTLMIGCGAAAAISGIFDSPIAGVIFSIEVILIEITIGSFIPLLIASALGSLTSMLLLEDEILFSFDLMHEFQVNEFLFFIALGICCGLVSVYFTRATSWAENMMQKINNAFLRATVGGLLLGVIVLFFSPIYGEGYNAIKQIINDNATNMVADSWFLFSFTQPWWLIMIGFIILLIKPLATGITIGSGGNGGISAPSLFMGGITGFLFSTINNLLAIGKELSVMNFTLIGMCGVMSGVLHAPLTAVFLIAEITSGYTLFLPLMLVSAIAYSTNIYFQKHSFYTEKLIKAGDLIPYDKDRQVLNLIKITKLIEKDLLTIHPQKTLGDLVLLVKKSKRNIFPVVNDANELQGIITLDDIRDCMFDIQAQKTMIVEQLMNKSLLTVSPKDRMEAVMLKFEKTGAWNLPVIEQNKYLGIVSKSRIFNAYRNQLKRQNKE